VEEGVLDLLGDPVALLDADGGVDLDVQLGAQPVTGPPGPGRGDVLDPGDGRRDLLQQAHGRLVGAVHDPAQDAPGGVLQDEQDGQGDHQADHGVGPVEPEQHPDRAEDDA